MENDYEDGFESVDTTEDGYTEENAAYWGEDFDEESFWNGDQEKQEALEAPKAPRYEGLCYMVAYRGAKTLLARVKGKRIVEIYKRRKFVEIEKTEFDRLVKIVKGIA
jgi:hypothetical protein